MHSPQNAPPPEPRRSYVRRVLKAVLVGAVAAGFLSMYAFVVYAITGALHRRDGSGPPLGTLVRAYFVAGIAAGGVVGLLGPIIDAGKWGRRFVGAFAGAAAVPLFFLPLFHDPIAVLVFMAVIGAAGGAWMAEDDTTLQQTVAYRRWLRERGLKEP